MSFVDDALKQRVKQDCEFSFLFNPLYIYIYRYISYAYNIYLQIK